MANSGITEQVHQTKVKTTRPMYPERIKVRKLAVPSSSWGNSDRVTPGPNTLCITAVASSTRPLLSSQRGDSGVPRRSTRNAKPGTAALSTIHVRAVVIAGDQSVVVSDGAGVVAGVGQPYRTGVFGEQ